MTEIDTTDLSDRELLEAIYRMLMLMNAPLVYKGPPLDLRPPQIGHGLEVIRDRPSPFGFKNTDDAESFKLWVHGKAR